MADLDKAIHAFDIGTLDPNSQFAMAFPSGSGYATGRISGTALAEGLLKDVPVAVNTSEKNVIGAINELATVSSQVGYAVDGVLEAGETSITLTSSRIHEDSTLDFYTDTFGVNPTAVSISEGSVTLSFFEQENDVNVRVIIRGVNEGGGGVSGTVIDYFFKPEDLIANAYITTSGQQASYSNWSCTDFIEVTPNETVHCASNDDDTYNCWYDENKAFISSFRTPKLGYAEMTVPNNAYYVRYSNRTDIIERMRFWREIDGE